jgi:hypothetical protein
MGSITDMEIIILYIILLFQPSNFPPSNNILLYCFSLHLDRQLQGT